MAERFVSALLIHGAGGGGWEWRIWQSVLTAAGLRVAAPDLLPSAAGVAATTLDDYVGQVDAALCALSGPRLLVGASLGGLLALANASQANALVLVNPLPPAPLHTMLPRREWPDLVPWQQQARLQSTLRALPDADPAAALFAFRHWRDESGAVLRRAHAGVAVARADIPILCIASTADLDIPLAVSRTLATAWECELMVLQGASHAGPLLGRSAAETASRMLSWLSRL